jgi:hypothetical protein
MSPVDQAARTKSDPDVFGRDRKAGINWTEVQQAERTEPAVCLNRRSARLEESAPAAEGLSPIAARNQLSQLVRIKKPEAKAGEMAASKSASR